MKTIFRTLLLLACLASLAHAQLAVTEINSNSDATDDWFEITNVGGSTVDISGWGFDDFPENVDNIVPLLGVSSIGAGESVVFVQLDEDLGTPAADQVGMFRDAWGGLSGVQIGYHNGSGLGRDDGVTIFGADQMMVVQQIYFDPSLDPPADAHAGEWAGGANIDSAIWNPNSDPSAPIFVAPVAGQYGVFAASDGGLGSPGAVVPEPSNSWMALVGGLAILGWRRNL